MSCDSAADELLISVSSVKTPRPSPAAIRRKLGEHAGLVETVRGTGYRDPS